MQKRYSHPSGPSLASIERPNCPMRDERMSLASKAPGPSASDLEMFECTSDHLEIANDPMKSDGVLWLAGHDLRSPT
jgi:hypothetical protein